MPGDENNPKVKKSNTRKLSAGNGASPFLTRNFNTGSLGVLPWAIELRVIGTPNTIKLPQKETILLGRADDRSTPQPDIDMTQYNGQYQGVSRRHAIISVRDNRVAIQDLGSVNGTFINGHILKPNQVYRLRDADRLRLGLLELQVHFVVKPSTQDDTLVGLENAMNIPTLGSGQRILILDDNPDVCRIIQHVAEHAGFEVSIANTAVEAIRFLGENKIDALILELVLPDANGLDVVNYIRNLYTRHIPVLAVTGATAGFRINQALRQGVDFYIAKPVAVDQLLESLGKLVGIMSKS